MKKLLAICLCWFLFWTGVFVIERADRTVYATIATETTRMDYSGNGATTIFPYSFKIYAKTDLLVIVRDASGNETTQTVDSDYTVSGVGVGAGGNVTMTTAPASTETLLILRNRPLKQETDYIAGGPFLAESHEDALDELTIIVQQLQEQLNRSVHVKKSSTLTDIQISDVTAGEYLRWDLLGTGIDSTAAVYDLGNFLQSGTGAVSKTAISKMGEILSVKDFGALGDGVADDSAAIQAAIDAVGVGGRLFAFAGTYNFASGLTFKNDMTLTGIGIVTFDGLDSTLHNSLPSSAQNITIENIRFTRWDRTIKNTDTNLITNITIRNCIFDNSHQGIYLPIPATRIYILNNTFEDITEAGATSAIQIGKAVDEATQGEYWIKDNIINTVTNTGVGNDDVHGIICRGYNVNVIHNSLRDITSGGGVGCEGIYVVGHYSKIQDNTLWNAGDDEASIVLKGGRDDEVIPQGSFGYDNIISDNTLFSNTASARAIYSTADDLLITNNTIEGFPGNFAVAISADTIGNHVIDNFFTKLTGMGAIKFTSASVHATNNMIEYPQTTTGTFYGIYVDDASNAVTDAEIKDNYFIVDDTFTATVYYSVYFDAATNGMNKIRCLNRSLSTNSGSTVYGIGFIGANGVSSADCIFGGHYRGTYSKKFRWITAYYPTNYRMEFDDGEMTRTAIGALSISAHENNKIITNENAVATATVLLLPAEVNMKFTFVRIASQTFRIDPDGTEIIRGGGAGKYLELDTDGDSVVLECVEAGKWEIAGGYGTYAYEA